MNENYDTVWVQCSCYSHLISVSRWKGFPDIELSVWGPSEVNNDSWRKRVRRAWHALKGDLHLDNISLDPEEARLLADTLDRMISSCPD